MKKKYLFKATVTFDIDPKSTDQQSISRYYACKLDQLDLQHTHEFCSESLERGPFPAEPRYSLMFHITSQTGDLKSVHYLALILEGEAGLLSLHKDVYSFSVHLIG